MAGNQYGRSVCVLLSSVQQIEAAFRDGCTDVMEEEGDKEGDIEGGRERDRDRETDRDGEKERDKERETERV